jgi:hypothetical protein
MIYRLQLFFSIYIRCKRCTNYPFVKGMDVKNTNFTARVTQLNKNNGSYQINEANRPI